MQVRALPTRLRFSEEKGYQLRVKIVDGPQHILDKVVWVSFTGDQLNDIAEWVPSEGTSMILDLEKKGTRPV